MKPTIGIATLLVLLGLQNNTAFATDQILHGRMLLQPGKYDIHVKTPNPASQIKMGNTVGIVLFDDGSIAEKHYIFSQNNREDEGSVMGFTTYRFANGDSMTFEFSGGWDEKGNAGSYGSLLHGTGKFKDATVTGTWVAGSSPWYDTMVVDVTLNISFVQ